MTYRSSPEADLFALLALKIGDADNMPVVRWPLKDHVLLRRNDSSKRLDFVSQV
jgi:hypothetical protein